MPDEIISRGESKVDGDDLQIEREEYAVEKKGYIRAHMRMDVTILLQYRKLTLQEYEDIEGKNFSCGDESSSDSFSLHPFMEEKENEKVAENVDPFVINSLIDINTKLSLVLSMLSCEETCIFTQQPMEANLSEGGIGFTIKEEVEKGQFLEIEILMPSFPTAVMKVWGKVVRTNPLPEGGYSVGIEYTHIKEEYQDKIVRYLFKKQREMLRCNKVSKKADDS